MLFKLFILLVKKNSISRLLFLQSSRHWSITSHDQIADKRSNLKNPESTAYGNALFSRETPKELHEQSQISEVDRDGVRCGSMENYVKHKSLESNDGNLLISR